MRPLAGLLVAALCISTFTGTAMAQRTVVRHPSPVIVQHHHHPGLYHHWGPYHWPYRRPNDFDRTIAALGTVAAIANARRPQVIYQQPAVVVAPSQPTVIVTQPNPVVVQRPPVVVAQQGTFSPTLGAWFRIENMQIPGHRFTAARLTSDPLPDSPLNRLGLRHGDVITRLNDIPANSLRELERPRGHTTVRYIKTGTVQVLLGNTFIPTNRDVYLAP